MITKANEKDYDDIIDFGNYAFSTADFPTLLPKLYENKPEIAKKHFVVKEDGKIKAMVGLFDIDFNVLGNDLIVKGIGTVSVHRYSRKKGYMQKLMEAAVADAQNENVDFIVLSGDRQRYEYFGFTPTGLKIKANISQATVKHLSKIYTLDYKFVTDFGTDVVELASKLHSERICHSNRQDFMTVARSWDSNVTAVYKDEDFVGFIIHSKDKKRISEVCLKQPEDINTVVVQFCNQQGGCEVILYPYQRDEIRAINSICENGCVITTCCNINVVNYENTIKAFLKLKASQQRLICGELVIDIENKGRYRITCGGKTIKVSQTTIEPNISLTHLEAMLYMFSPGSFFEYHSEIASSWFPLPLFIHEADNV